LPRKDELSLHYRARTAAAETDAEREASVREVETLTAKLGSIAYNQQRLKEVEGELYNPSNIELYLEIIRPVFVPAADFL
jgi:hypothetical protein